MLIFLIWFALAVVIGALAAGKDRSGLGWFLLAMLDLAADRRDIPSHCRRSPAGAVPILRREGQRARENLPALPQRYWTGRRNRHRGRETVMLRFAVLGACALVLAGCAKTYENQIWMRLDGQRMTGNPAFEQKFQVDRTICTGETQKANMSGAQFCQGIVNCAVAQSTRTEQADEVFKGCMAEKGYSLVLREQAEEKRAEFEAATRAAQSQPTAPPTPSKKR